MVLDSPFNNEKPKVNIIRYATVFSFWTMLVMWEIEAMRIIGKMSEFRNKSSFSLALGILQFDSTMVLVTIFAFISSAFYFYLYEKKWFGLMSSGFASFFLLLAILK